MKLFSFFFCCLIIKSGIHTSYDWAKSASVFFFIWFWCLILHSTPNVQTFSNIQSENKCKMWLFRPMSPSPTYLICPLRLVPPSCQHSPLTGSAKAHLYLAGISYEGLFSSDALSQSPLQGAKHFKNSLQVAVLISFSGVQNASPTPRN